MRLDGRGRATVAIEGHVVSRLYDEVTVAIRDGHITSRRIISYSARFGVTCLRVEIDEGTTADHVTGCACSVIRVIAVDYIPFVCTSSSKCAAFNGQRAVIDIHDLSFACVGATLNGHIGIRAPESNSNRSGDSTVSSYCDITSVDIQHTITGLEVCRRNGMSIQIQGHLSTGICVLQGIVAQYPSARVGQVSEQYDGLFTGHFHHSGTNRAIIHTGLNILCHSFFHAESLGV